MFCSKCGANVSEGVAFCPACGQAMGAPSAAAAARVTYAGFWLRFVAVIIDAIAIGIVTLPIRIALMAALGLQAMMHPQMGESPEMMLGTILPTVLLSATISIVAQWLYYGFMESSAWQATLGKKALGLKVTDLAGNRIGFGQASGRFFGKILSGLTLLIGYIMAGFTQKKQALHDIIAGCLVIRQT